MANVLYKKEFKKFHLTEHQNFCDINQIYEEGYIPAKDRDHFIKHPTFKYLQTHEDEQTFKDNINNPLFSIFSTRIIIVVEETDEKIAFKLFTSNFERRVGKAWFKLSKNVDYITVNRKTGDVYIGYIHNYQKKRKAIKCLRKNYFVNDTMSNMASRIKNILNGTIPNPAEIANEASSVFIDSIIKRTDSLTKEQKLFKFYLDKKGYKYPNNFDLYRLTFWHPEFKKNLKKNGKKLVDALMTFHQVNGKKLKKFLHISENLNIENYITFKKLFGEEWLSQDDHAILKLLNHKYNFNSSIAELKDHLSKEELKRVFKMVMDSVCEDQIDIYTFNDHVRMYLELKAYGETDLKWYSDGTDYPAFSKEHLDWVEKLDHYKRGVYTRHYPDYFFEQIQKPIGDYYPVILTNSNEYNNESLVQSNCVKSYIGRPGSFIISLRMGGVDSEERITIEYRIVYLINNEKVHTDRVQTLGRFNSPIDESWTDILLKLDERVLSCHQDKNFEPVKITKECSNGMILKSDSHFEENGSLKWSYKKSEELFYYRW